MMATENLQVSDTVAASEIRHRLALGLTWMDSISQLGVPGVIATILENIGGHPLNIPFERHGSNRFALRYGGTIKKRLEKALKDGTSSTWILNVHGRHKASGFPYHPGMDPRMFVPRRFSMNLVFQEGIPAPGTANIRTPWLLPGSAYPFPATSTIIRGRVIRGTELSTARPVRWARLFATIPETQKKFDEATIAGCAHGDDRGEFVMALDSRVVSGAALKNPVQVRLWAFVPPANAIDLSSPLDDLPVEIAGADPLNDTLRGITVPVTYIFSQSTSIHLQLGETKNDTATTLLFPP